jgi:F-type H+-transporting ATPase subunit delta
MTNRAVATRYARALLDVSQQDTDPQRVEREVSIFAELMASNANLGNSLINPCIPPDRKRALMTQVVARMGDVLPITRRLLMLLADRDRLSLLEDILSAYREALMALRGVVRAQVTTSSELPQARVEAITKTLEDATGKKVQVETGVDPAILGGMVTRIGSTIYDGSVAGHLGRLRRRFLSER